MFEKNVHFKTACLQNGKDHLDDSNNNNLSPQYSLLLSLVNKRISKQARKTLLCNKKTKCCTTSFSEEELSMFGL